MPSPQQSTEYIIVSIGGGRTLYHCSKDCPNGVYSGVAPIHFSARAEDAVVFDTYEEARKVCETPRVPSTRRIVSLLDFILEKVD